MGHASLLRVGVLNYAQKVEALLRPRTPSLEAVECLSFHAKDEPGLIAIDQTKEEQQGRRKTPTRCNDVWGTQIRPLGGGPGHPPTVMSLVGMLAEFCGYQLVSQP